MSNPVRLVPIDANIRDGYLLVPHGMTPVFLHEYDGRKLVHVSGYDPKNEYDSHLFDLYPLDRCTRSILVMGRDGQSEEQEWCSNFGEPTKEALVTGGELTIRDRPPA